MGSRRLLPICAMSCSTAAALCTTELCLRSCRQPCAVPVGLTLTGNSGMPGIGQYSLMFVSQTPHGQEISSRPGNQFQAVFEPKRMHNLALRSPSTQSRRTYACTQGGVRHASRVCQSLIPWKERRDCGTAPALAARTFVTKSQPRSH